MSARDTIHNAVKNALIKDGWTITHDPYRVAINKSYAYVDLGAEQFLTAERQNQKIAVEIKSLAGRSPIYDLEQAVGQCVIYHAMIRRKEPGRMRYMAIPRLAYAALFLREPGNALIEDGIVQLIVVDIEQEEIVEWIHSPATDR